MILPLIQGIIDVDNYYIFNHYHLVNLKFIKTYLYPIGRFSVFFLAFD